MEARQTSLLLDLPPELVASILTLPSLAEALLVLWSTGSKALQEKLARSVTRVNIDVRDVPLKSSPANFFPFFRKLRHLSIYDNFHRSTAPAAIDNLALVLQDVNPGLKSLLLDFDLDLELIHRTPPSRSHSRHPNTSRPNTGGRGGRGAAGNTPNGNNRGRGRGRGIDGGRGRDDHRGGRGRGDNLPVRGNGGRGGRGRGADDNNAGRGRGGPRRGATAPNPSSRDASSSGRGGTGIRGGRGGNRGGRGGQFENDSTSAPSALPSPVVIDFPRQFPSLSTLSVSSDAPSIACLKALPSSLTSFRFSRYPDTEQVDLSAWLRALPRGLKTLGKTDHRFGSYDPLSSAHLADMPPHLTDLDLEFREVMGWEGWPKSLTRVASCSDQSSLGSAHYAKCLPRCLETLALSGLSIDFVIREEAIRHLPPTLLALTLPDPTSNKVEPAVIRFQSFTSQLLRLLPRTLTMLKCYLELDGLQLGDFPPGLTEMHLYTKENLPPNFGSLLPTSLRSLKLPYILCPPDNSFYAQLPRALTDLHLHVDDIDEIIDFPPNLRSLMLGDEYLRYSPGHGNCSTYLNDGDATLTPAPLDPSTPIPSARTNVMLPYSIKRPFPFHLLPHTLTSFTYNDRPFPASALRFLPQLRKLFALELIRDPRFDPRDAELVAQVNKARSKVNVENPSAALPMLTVVGIFDLLPRGIEESWIARSGELNDTPKELWILNYPALKFFTGSSYRHQFEPRWPWRSPP